jgi:L-threonylcarbamoyladenylate synthase
MSGESMNPRTLASPIVEPISASAVSQAVESLEAGGLVVMPTDTIYGVFARADSVEALAALKGLTGEDSRAWHTPSLEAVARALHGRAKIAPLHQRLIDRLLPGPVTFIVPETMIDGAWVPASVRHASGMMSFRVTDEPQTHAVLERLWARGRFIVGTGWERSRADARISLVLDAGPTRLGQPSTQIRLGREGGRAAWSIEREGALPSWVVQEAGTKRVLIVCTGNTCRSPMAAALARHELAQGQPEIPTVIESAGLAASEGEPMTPEAIEVLGSMGVAASRGGARPITREMVRRADEIWTMTDSHRRQIVTMDPSAAGKTTTIDPSGDVPDPIGGTRALYLSTAERLRALVARRLVEG